MNYTDEELKRVAEWLGVFEDEERTHYFRLRDQDGSLLAEWIHDYFDDVPYSAEFEGWLLSPEGRVAIEDKFIELDEGCACAYCPDDGSDEYVIFNDVFRYRSDALEIRGAGETSSGAWLSAAVEFTKKGE